jgi:S-adenosylmethionine:tRNA ribosyltransferase-isomerase
MRVDDFDYELPPELIAQRPPAARDGGRLLVLSRETGAIEHSTIRELGRHLPPRCLLVVNDSRVIPARLLARRATGGQVEVLLLEREAIEGEAREVWRAMVRSSKPLRVGEPLAVTPRADAPAGVAVPGLRVLERPREGRARVEVEGGTPAVSAHGAMPIPPYLGRPDEPADRERYQTVYARLDGSVAAPTAGLHFTPELLARLEADHGVERTALTLHVGLGTFVPVRAEAVEDHVMEEERYELSQATAAAIARARAEGRRVVAVGTTAVRTLEATGGAAGAGRTDLFIVPGHRFRVVEAMLTNFHLPRSTLLMLVSAFAGRERILAAYREAVRARYRFYSFGDAMLIL